MERVRSSGGIGIPSTSDRHLPAARGTSPPRSRTAEVR